MPVREHVVVLWDLLPGGKPVRRPPGLLNPRRLTSATPIRGISRPRRGSLWDFSRAVIRENVNEKSLYVNNFA